jgi:hypothetical protein
MTPLRVLLTCLAALALLAGCEDPYAQRSTDPASTAEAERARQQQARGDELAPLRPERDAAPHEPAGKVAATARAATERFCAQWANWSWRTIDRQQARLATLATAGLRRQLEQEAAAGRLDRTLRRDRLSISGRVVALDVRPGGGRRRAVCVTHEEELQHGRGELGGGRHRVYLATLERGPKGWGVRAWQPQP